MFKNLFIVALGGSLGAILRHLANTILPKIINSSFLNATFIVNICGSFFIGIVWGFSQKNILSNDLKLLIITGFLGALTTFSSFALENLRLFIDGKLAQALLTITIHNILTISFAFLGFKIISLLNPLQKIGLLK